MRHLRTTRLIQSAIRPLFDTLEERRLLSFSLDAGVLTITGTAGADNIRIAVQAGDSTRYSVSDGQTTQTITTASVNQFVVDALGGDDLIVVDESNGVVTAPRTIFAGDGNDTVLGATGVDIIHGGNGNDSLAGGVGADVIFGEVGNDTIRGGRGDDTIYGGQGSDSLIGGMGQDVMYGGVDSDTMEGNQGFDRLYGEAGNDMMMGGQDDDKMYGGAGDDTLAGGLGNDILGGDTEDIVQFQGGVAPPTVVGNDSLIGGDGSNTLLGHTGIDTLVGGSGSNVFDARNDADVIIGRDPQTEVRPSEAVFTEPVVSDITVTLQIFVNDNGTTRQVLIPDGAGSFSGGTSVAEATDSNGTIEFRDRIPRTFQLGEFFQQWGVTFDLSHVGRFVTGNGHTLTMTVNGTPNFDYNNLVVQNGDNIVITYT